MFKNLKIAVKLAFGFSIAVIALIVVIILSIINMSSMNDNIETIVKDRFQKTVFINNVIEQLNLSSMALRDGIIENHPEEIAKYAEAIKNTGAVAKPILDTIKGKLNTDKGKEMFAQIMDARGKYAEIRDKIVGLMQQNQDSIAGEILFTEFQKAREGYEGQMNELKKYLVNLVNVAADEAYKAYVSSRTLMLIISAIALVLLVIIALLITNSITKPIKQAVTAADNIAKGNLKVDLNTTNRDETGKLLNAMKSMAGSIDDLVAETETLIDAANKGKLDIRGKADKFTGSWNDLVTGINHLVDSFVSPINVTAEYVDRISKGDIPPRITEVYQGDFNEIKNNINGCIDVMNGLLAETNTLIQGVRNGKLDNRADSSKFIGAWGSLVAGINNIIDDFVAPFNVTAEYVDRLSKGDMPPKIKEEYKGDFNEIKNNVNVFIDVMGKLKEQTDLLINAVKEGKLDLRAQAGNLTGSWGELINGINNIVDNFVGPINMTAEYIDRISKGDIPQKVDTIVKGDFNEIKNNINLCIDSINNLVADSNMIARAAIEARLDTRADALKHNGDFRKIIQGLNKTLDNIVGYFEAIPTPLQFMDKDFNILYINKTGADLLGKSKQELMTRKCKDMWKTDKCNTNSCPCQVSMDRNDVYTCENSCTVNNNHLEIFCAGAPIRDESGKVIGSFEFVLDQTEIKTALKEANIAMDEANRAKADVQVAMEKSSKISRFQDLESAKIVHAVETLSNGDFSIHVELSNPDEDTKDAYNTLMGILFGVRKFKDSVIALQEDALTLVKYAEEGQLDKRLDITRHKGEFQQVVVGMNNILDEMLEPINEASKNLEVMATGDLTTRMVGQYKGDHVKMKESINTLGDSLSSLIKQVAEMAQGVASIATEMSSAAETMAAGAQEQSAQADDVASAVEEMSRTITENAMAAGRTAEEADKNKKVAQEGGDVVAQTVSKMKDIAGVVSQSATNMEKLGESSTKIGEIISVIDDIADQTNLLALNAAIEAARAGEQGRGFAVVADEVRKLAERTTEATKQIAGMIKGIQSETQDAVRVMNQGNQEVTNGIQLADKAGVSLKEIVVSSQEVQDMINRIAAASEEQSSTSEEISKNVTAISQVSSDTANQINDIAHSAEELSRMIAQMAEQVSFFKVDSGDRRQTGKDSRTLKPEGKRLPEKAVR